MGAWLAFCPTKNVPGTPPIASPQRRIYCVAPTHVGEWLDPSLVN